MGVTILVAEDDRGVADGLRDVFAAQKYGVILASTRREALDALRNRSVDLAVLDVSLGTEDGFALCREARRFSDIPILFLTAKSGEEETVEGFRAGGDDYLTKPFRVRELLARVEALLRRTKGRADGGLTTGALTVEPENHILRRDDRPVGLSAVEWSLLTVLLRRAPNAVTREALLFEVWDKDADFVEENTLSVNMSRLRAKLGDYRGRPYIETIRGFGYRWAVPVRR